MQKLVLDFDLTVLFPLMLFALIVLWKSGRAYLSSNTYCKAAERRLTEPFIEPFSTNEDREALLELYRDRQEQRQKATSLLWFSVSGLVILSAALLTVDSWKIWIAYLVWYFLWFASGVSFIIAIPVAWHYAKKLDWLVLGVCMLVMLLAAASAEHFFHQKINARHVACPQCTDDDDDGADDN